MSEALIRAVAALLRVRWLVRLPLWLYRARLGLLVGHRMLMMEHIGRRSGLRRQVVLEVGTPQGRRAKPVPRDHQDAAVFDPRTPTIAARPIDWSGSE